MKKRQSIRTYDIQSISESDLKQIQKYISNNENLCGPFHRTGRIEFVQVTHNTTDKGIKLGTYGFIKNPRAYIVGVCENNTNSLIEFGYVFHKLVLYMTEMHIGTCWMGGTFNRNSFEKEINIREDEFIPCITPIGYPKDKQRVFNKALRLVVKADNKKGWDQLFYYTNFTTSLNKEDAGDLKTPIEMVRIGPSASNKQPWRVLLSQEKNLCHFYIEHTPNYSTKLGYDMQLLDMGIAMCQFDLACKELNVFGEWIKDEPKVQVPNDNFEYIATWSRIG
ncbi:nitroreductase [Bacillus sp. HMF5848]|nr:nitroreductase [Bacillus sp. HMF5848]